MECRACVEARIERPFLVAALAKGATQAAFDMAWNGELAVARNEEAAAIMTDMKSYFDHIEILEFARGAIEQGLPKSVIILCMHLYLGPRRLRVEEAVSRRTWPRRSVIAGCTWAMTHVRLHVISPADQLLEEIRTRIGGAKVGYSLTIMVDDASLLLWGERAVLTEVLKWACAKLFRWIRDSLRKEVAKGKTQGIVSSTAFKKIVEKPLAKMGVPVALHGDMLGIDCSGGGELAEETDTDQEDGKSRETRENVEMVEEDGWDKHAHREGKG